MKKLKGKDGSVYFEASEEEIKSIIDNHEAKCRARSLEYYKTGYMNSGHFRPKNNADKNERHE